LSDETCKSTQKWSNEQDDWWCTWFIFIADWALTHWNDNKIDAHTETDQINMKNSLKREIQRSSFSIFDIKDDTSTFATAQELCKVSQRIIDAAMHEKNWLQLISTWKMSIWCCYNNMQVQQRSNVNQAHFINMFQMKSRMKSNAMRREHHVINASELIKTSQDLVKIWLKFNSNMTQHLFSSLTSSNQLLLSSK